MSIDANIGSRIKSRREELGMSQEELAHRIGYKSRSSINKIELGVYALTQSKIKAIADALLTTPSYIMGWEEDKKAIEVQSVPLIGTIACGEPILAEEHFECYVKAGARIHCDFCLRARGDSMINARIHDGDIVFIHQQDEVENGEIAAVIVENEATLKRVYDYADRIVLQAENPAYEPLVYVGEEKNLVRILGKAVAFQSDVK
jgi:repressor LexA